MTAETTHNRVSAMVSSMVRDKNEQDCVVRCAMDPFNGFLGVGGKPMFLVQLTREEKKFHFVVAFIHGPPWMTEPDVTLLPFKVLFVGF